MRYYRVGKCDTASQCVLKHDCQCAVPSVTSNCQQIAVVWICRIELMVISTLSAEWKSEHSSFGSFTRYHENNSYHQIMVGIEQTHTTTNLEWIITGQATHSPSTHLSAELLFETGTRETHHSDPASAKRESLLSHSDNLYFVYKEFACVRVY